MLTSCKNVRPMTLGDLIVAAFDHAEESAPFPMVIAALAAREVQRRLDHAHRPDLIRALMAAERQAQSAAPGRPRASPAVRRGSTVLSGWHGAGIDVWTSGGQSRPSTVGGGRRAGGSPP